MRTSDCSDSLRYVEVDNQARSHIASWYDEYLLGAPGVSIVPMAPGITSSRHLCQVQVGHRNEVMAGMNTDNFFTGVHYHSCADYSMYA